MANDSNLTNAAPRMDNALEQSCLLGPLYRMASVGLGNYVTEHLKHSTLLKPAKPIWHKLISVIDQLIPQIEKQSVVAKLLQRLCLAALVVLFVGSTFYSTTFVGLMVAVLFGLVLITALLLRQPLIKQLTTIDVAVFFFFISLLIATAFSSVQPQAMSGLTKMITFFAAYLGFRWFSQHWRLWLAGLGFIILSAIIQSAVGWEQYHHFLQPLATWQDPNIDASLRLKRIYGTIQTLNPNLLAGYLAPCVPLVFGAALWAGSAWLFAKERLKVRHLAYGLPTIILSVCALLTLWALVATGSRGAYIAIVLIGLTPFLYTGHLLFHQAQLKSIAWLKWLWLGVLALVVLGGSSVVLTSESLRFRVLSIFAMHGDSSIAYRLNVYHSAWEMFKDNWLFGIGPGNGVFKQIYGLYMKPGYNALGAYSVPLEIMVEQGLLGLMSYLLLGLTILFRAVFLLEAKVSLPVKLLGGVLLLSLMGHIGYGFFDTIWYRPTVNILFWFVLAGFAALTQQAICATQAKTTT